MDQSLEVINIKKEPTDFISTCEQEMPINSIKEKNNCFLFIKTEAQEDEDELPVTAGSSYKMYPNYNVKIEASEPLMKLESENFKKEIMEDPLDPNRETRVENEEHLLSESDNTEETEKLYNHLINEQIRRRTCHLCNKVYKKKSSLNRHLRVHTGEKPFSCHVCTKSFSQKSILTNHILIHIGEKPFECSVCMKVFSRKAHLNDHMMIHSGEKPFSCNDCDKTFRDKNNFARHRLIHTGEKPYTCDLCGKSFRHKNILTIHKRSHTGEKPFTCDVCNKSFVQKSALTKHQRTHDN